MYPIGSQAPTNLCSGRKIKKKRKAKAWSRRVRVAELRPSGSLNISQVQQGRSFYSSNTNVVRHFGVGCRDAWCGGKKRTVLCIVYCSVYQFIPKTGIYFRLDIRQISVTALYAVKQKW